MAQISRSIIDFAHLDRRQVLPTLLFRGVYPSGGLTVLMVAIWLSPVQQEYHYTLASIIAPQQALNGVYVLSETQLRLDFDTKIHNKNNVNLIQNYGVNIIY